MTCAATGVVSRMNAPMLMTRITDPRSPSCGAAPTSTHPKPRVDAFSVYLDIECLDVTLYAEAPGLSFSLLVGDGQGCRRRGRKALRASFYLRGREEAIDMASQLRMSFNLEDFP
jgi:hypothetical protein